LLHNGHAAALYGLQTLKHQQAAGLFTLLLFGRFARNKKIKFAHWDLEVTETLANFNGILKTRPV
jgi:hypothetical protein